MYCNYCKEYVSLDNETKCQNKYCLLLDKILKKYGVKKIIQQININYLN